MQIFVDKKPSLTVNDSVVRKVLGIYPEELLESRKFFDAAFRTGGFEFKDLQAEADTILIPWQLFLLEEAKLDAELKRIEDLRLEKVSEKLIVKRKGYGDITSKRILDRLIRSQNYLIRNGTFEVNDYCGSLKGKSISQAAKQITTHFEVNASSFRRGSKRDALAYLIEKIENKQINVCQGVLDSNKILPVLDNSRSVYKNTSGFAIKDDRVPFIFIPSEINPDEREGRQILTLVYLIALVGLDEYNFVLRKDFKTQLLTAKGIENLAYNIASEFLLPWSVTAGYRGTQISEALRDFLSSKYQLSPTAVVTILRKRRVISSFEEYSALLPDPPPPGKSKSEGGRTPSIERSVRKFLGKLAYEVLNGDIRSKKTGAVRAQYIIFGSPRKRAFFMYRKNLGL